MSVVAQTCFIDRQPDGSPPTHGDPSWSQANDVLISAPPAELTEMADRHHRVAGRRVELWFRGLVNSTVTPWNFIPHGQLASSICLLTLRQDSQPAIEALDRHSTEGFRRFYGGFET